MGLKEFKNGIDDRLLARKMRHVVRSGDNLLEQSIRDGAVESRAIEIFRKDRQVLEIVAFEGKEDVLIRKLSEERPDTDYNLLIQNPDLIQIHQQIYELKRKLSMAQLCALLQIHGEKIEASLKEHRL